VTTAAAATVVKRNSRGTSLEEREERRGRTLKPWKTTENMGIFWGFPGFREIFWDFHDFQRIFYFFVISRIFSGIFW
jgi:hypothetical protein